MQLAVTTGGLVDGNIGRRIGYCAVDDTSAAQPKYLAGQYAVFIDTSGTAGVDYTNNTCVSALGAFFDLDGFSYGRVSGNTCRVPSSSDPEYTEDLISSWPGNFTYGVQTANNYYAPGGTNVSITDNLFVNCGEGAIRLFAARGCHIAGNTINHPSGAAFAPIILCNFVPAMGGGQIDTADCDVTMNNIQWSPSTALAAIQEIENWGAGSMPWSGEVNWIADNKLFGANAFEFAKAPSSNSVSGFLVSNAAATSSAANYASSYADSAALHLSINGGPFKPVARVGGSASHVQFNDTSGVNLAGSANLTWDNGGNVLTVGGGAGSGIVASTFNSNATGSTNALQQASGTFYVTGAGVAGFQSVAVTGLVAAGSMTISGVAVATQAWVTAGFIGGSNISYGGNILTLIGSGNGVVSTTFNSSATGATNAVQQASGTFSITGAGDAAFQSVAVTGLVAAGSMTIAGVAVATQAWVTAGFIGGTNISYGANILTLIRGMAWWPPPSIRRLRAQRTRCKRPAARSM